MVTLADVLRIPELGLTAVTPGQSTEEVRWAHVSELLDPTPWLLGGELLLTTGVYFYDGDLDYLHYCQRLVNAGVAGLGMSTGPELPHPSVPAELREAAEEAGLTLVHVPQETLLQTVIQRVSELINDARNEPMYRAFSAQRVIGETSTSRHGVDRVVAGLARTMGLSVVVFDERLRIVATSDGVDSEQIAQFRQELKPRLREGLRWSVSSEGTGETVVAQPLGIEGRLRGILVVRSERTLTTQDRVVLGTSVSLLSLLLELRYVNSGVTRAVRDHFMDAVVAESISRDDLAGRLREADCEGELYRVLVSAVPTKQEFVVAFVTELSEISAHVLVHAVGEELVVLLVDPVASAHSAIDTLVRELGVSPAGLGNELAAGGIYESMHQARFARSIAQARGLAFLERAEAGGYRDLLALGNNSERREFANDVLSRLFAEDSKETGEGYLATLQAFLRSVGNLESAAQLLGIHRHTMRKRLHRIEEIIGRDLSRSEDLFEVWLAVELRGVNGLSG